MLGKQPNSLPEYGCVWKDGTHASGRMEHTDIAPPSYVRLILDTRLPRRHPRCRDPVTKVRLIWFLIQFVAFS